MIHDFTKEWWGSFLQKNQNFTRACVMKNALDDNLKKELHSGVLDVIRNRFALKHLNDGLRIYLDGKEQNLQFMKELSKDPPTPNDTIETYTKRKFKDKFGFIINAGEKHSDILNTEIVKRIQPLFEQIGTPATGIEITIFIGDYGWTPLGIHQDHIGENVIHFHLGPGPKTMYVWEEDKYQTLTGEKPNNMDIEPLIPDSDVHPFESGDIFYMPWNNYHIGFSNTLSVGITVWFNNPTKTNFSKKIINSFYYQYINQIEDKEIIKPQIDYLNQDLTFDDFLSTLNLSEAQLSLNTKDFFKTVLTEFKYALLSNGGWQSVPLSQESMGINTGDSYYGLEGVEILSSYPFKIIHYDNSGDTISLFIRGSKIEMAKNEWIIQVLNRINTNTVVPVRELLKELPDGWPKEAGLYLLSLVYDKRGFEIV